MTTGGFLQEGFFFCRRDVFAGGGLLRGGGGCCPEGGFVLFPLMIYNITKTEHLYPLKHSLGTALSTSLSNVYKYFTYMIGLTKRSNVAPKMQHVTFCDCIVRFFLCFTNRIDSVCRVTWIPLCEKDGSVITWSRGKGETLSIYVVPTQCAGGLSNQRLCCGRNSKQQDNLKLETESFYKADSATNASELYTKLQNKILPSGFVLMKSSLPQSKH